MMKILVTTPGGAIGGRILRELLAPEFSVRVLSRHPEILPKKVQDQVELMHGPSDDVRTLRRALEGADAMFWCVPEGSLDQTNACNHYERFTRVASLAIRETGRPRVVAISASGPPSNACSANFDAMEEILNGSGAAIRHIRCGWLMENFLRQMNSILERGIISGPTPPDFPVPFTAAAVVADVALRRLVRTDWDGIESTVVHGPEALSFTQAAAVFERILRRPVQYQQDDSADGFVEIHEDSGSGAETKSPITTTLAVWVRREFVPLLKRLEKRSFSLGQVGSSRQPASRELNLSEVC